MGDNTLNNITTPKTVEADDVNQFFTALTGDFLPRNNPSGAIEDSVHSLGDSTTSWKNAYINNLYLAGVLFDPDNIGSGTDTKNAIVSGATRTTSGQPDFIRASGSGASATILATATPLQITANNTSVTISADIAVSSLTVAPSTNNTCLINDTALAGGAETKYVGEHRDNVINIDTAGSEITNRVGQYICLKGTTEYMLAYVESSAVLRSVKRGFFFDSSGSPIVREALSNNDTLTIMSLGWVFMDSNGTTVDVSYTSPVYSYTEPASPDADDYWFDMTNKVWKRYSGSAFVEQNRHLIGLVVIDQTNCVASRSFDFSKSYKDDIFMEVKVFSNTQIVTKEADSLISVYGDIKTFSANPVTWDITTDLETGLTEGSSTLYYCYITQDGEPILSEERPIDRTHDLKGWYHPYNTWRYVGVAYNNSSSNFSSANSHNKDEDRLDVFTSSGEFLCIPNKSIKVTVVGGGGGGGGSASGGSSGGTSSFGSLCSATGGSGGSGNGTSSAGGSGGSGSGGSFNSVGEDGGYGGCDNLFGISGKGGCSTHGGGGMQIIFLNDQSNGISGNLYGGGGSGRNFASGGGASGGGGGGGTAIELLQYATGRVTVTVGGGGSGGTSGGGNGAAGIVYVEYS